MYNLLCYLWLPSPRRRSSMEACSGIACNLLLAGGRSIRHQTAATGARRSLSHAKWRMLNYLLTITSNSFALYRTFNFAIFKVQYFFSCRISCDLKLFLNFPWFIICNVWVHCPTYIVGVELDEFVMYDFHFSVVAPSRFLWYSEIKIRYFEYDLGVSSLVE